MALMKFTNTTNTSTTWTPTSTNFYKNYLPWDSKDRPKITCYNLNEKDKYRGHIGLKDIVNQKVKIINKK